MKQALTDIPVLVREADTDKIFDIILLLSAGESCVNLRISDYHTNIVYIEKDKRYSMKRGSRHWLRLISLTAVFWMWKVLWILQIQWTRMMSVRCLTARLPIIPLSPRRGLKEHTALISVM